MKGRLAKSACSWHLRILERPGHGQWQASCLWLPSITRDLPAVECLAADMLMMQRNPSAGLQLEKHCECLASQTAAAMLGE